MKKQKTAKAARKPKTILMCKVSSQEGSFWEKPNMEGLTIAVPHILQGLAAGNSITLKLERLPANTQFADWDG